METRFLIEIPKEFAAIAGTPDPGTRIFRAEGSHEQMKVWFDALCEHVGSALSPGGAAVYSGTSRPGVLKRLKAGKMTAFCFHIVGKKKTLFGGGKTLKKLPLCYIPAAECRAWGQELEERAARIEENKERKLAPEDQAAFEEADGEFTSDMHDFLNNDPKDKGRKDVRSAYPWEDVL